MTSVLFYDAVFPARQPLGLGISSYTLAYTCAGATIAVDCVVVHDATDHSDIKKGDIIVAVNGQQLINIVSQELSNYDAVIKTLGNMIGEQRMLRFLRSAPECHDESVQAAIVAISPEEAALLYDPRYQNSCPELAEEMITSPYQSSSSSHAQSSSSIFPGGQQLHYNPVRNLEDEARRVTQRLSEELRFAEEEDARLIEVEVKRQLEHLARREYGQMASMLSTAPSVINIPNHQSSMATNNVSSGGIPEEEARQRLVEDQQLHRLNHDHQIRMDEERRRLEERRANERLLDDQIQFKRRLEDERR